MERAPQLKSRVETGRSLEMTVVMHTMKDSGIDKHDSSGVVKSEWRES